MRRLSLETIAEEPTGEPEPVAEPAQQPAPKPRRRRKVAA
jgi:hypothetical protein